MTAVKVTSTFYILSGFLLISFCSAQYKIPDVTIQAFKPKGFKAFIPDAQNVSLFAFQGNINQDIGNNGVGSISGEVVQPTNGQWTFEDPGIKLKIGDVIHYYVFVSINGAGYLRDNLIYKVTDLVNKSGEQDSIVFPSEMKDKLISKYDDNIQKAPEATSPPAGECKPTVTTVRGGNACAGQIVFEDNFISLNEDMWQVEQYIPATHTDYPFVSYQRHMVSIDDGNLRIRASLQQNEPGFTNDSVTFGVLDLINGCTSVTDKCRETASGADILPPVVTGRVVNKQFAFIYGTIHVRAKLPQGDWLYPQILLEPLQKIYGTQNLISGVFKIACARGNKELYSGIQDYGNRILYGGPVINSYCHDALLVNRLSSDGRYWGDDFHVYSLYWGPERIDLSVDGQEWVRLEPSASGLRSRLPASCRNATVAGLPQSASKVAPFDQYFHLTFGVDAGGISEFKEGIYTEGNRPKPWNNQARKAQLNFFVDEYAWYPTWNQPELLIDYVKVVAL